MKASFQRMLFKTLLCASSYLYPLTFFINAIATLMLQGLIVFQVCRDTCAGRMLNFLRSTEECRNDEEVQENASFIEIELCAYKDGEGEPETSCALQSESGIRVTVACLGWWFFGGSQCPALVDGVPVVASSCADALRTVVGEYGCCLQNIFGTEESIEEATQ